MKLFSLLLASALLALPAAAPAQSPPEAEMHFSTGVMHLREGRVDLALEEFKKAIKDDPKNPYFQKGLSQAYAAKREWSAAIQAARRALELNPYYVDAKNDLGYALIMSGDREGGKKEFLSAFSDAMNPAPEISALNLGRAYLEEGNYDEAVNWLQASINRNKTYTVPYLLLAETLVAANRVEQAVVELERANREVPGDPEILLALGRGYLKTGRNAEARTRLEEAAKADPGGPVGKAATEQLQSIPR
jgi:Flp pilus assembly protein TadD